MMEKTCLFLDTTIQIEKVLAGKERKREIQKNLKKGYVITSRYVLMEYIRTVVKDFYYIHTVLKEENSVEAAIDRIADEARSILSLKRCLRFEKNAI
jgi:predicted ABC-type ATPase